jgi:hypothetical protein
MQTLMTAYLHTCPLCGLDVWNYSDRYPSSWVAARRERGVRREGKKYRPAGSRKSKIIIVQESI